MSSADTLNHVLAALRGKRFPLEDEKQTQNAIERTLQSALGAGYWEREVRIAGGIIDFLAFGDVGIEVKLKGRAGEIRGQIARYAIEPRLKSLVLVTAKPVAIAEIINGKRCAVLDIARAWL